jgi:hypothetical protein
MASLMMRGLGAVVAAGLSVAAIGNGVASADPLIGMTYGDAAAAVAKYNVTAVIATVSGDQLDIDNCVVTSWNKSNFLDSRGRNSRAKEFRMNLNCNNRVASAGEPGNSSMSPEGAKAKKEVAMAETINTNPSWCHKDDQHMKWCGDVCKHTGMCEI